MAGDRQGGMTSEAFGTRFEACYRSLWTVAAAVLGSREGAEDAVQDAAHIGFRKRSAFDPQTDFCAWMAQIVRNVARNAGRKTRRRKAISLENVSVQASEGPTSETGVSTHGDLAPGAEIFDDRLTNALDQLSEEARACLLLRTVRGFSYEQIARLLEMPKGTAMSHVHRARGRLREILAETEPPQNRAKGETELEVKNG